MNFHKVPILLRLYGVWSYDSVHDTCLDGDFTSGVVDDFPIFSYWLNYCGRWGGAGRWTLWCNGYHMI